MNLNKYRIAPADAYPENMQLEVSRACPLKCPQCRRTHQDPQGRGELDPELLERLDPVFAQLDMLGICGWGEALTSPMVWQVVEAAHRHHANPCLTTNGLLLTEENCRRLVAQQLGQVAVSLDAGTPEFYRQVRPGSELERVIGNIRRLAALRDAQGSRTPFIVVTFNFHEQSAAELPHFVRLAATLPILKAVIHPYYPPQFGKGEPEDWRLSSRAREIYEASQSLARELGVKLEIHLRTILARQMNIAHAKSASQLYRPSLEEIQARRLVPTCRCMWDFPFVDCEGNVFPCSIYPKSCGNVRRASFEEVWASDGLNQLRQNLLTHQPNQYCLACHKTMWYPNKIDEAIPAHLPLDVEGLVGLGWYPAEPIARTAFRWSRGVATVYIRNTGQPQLYFVARALRETRLQISVGGRPALPLTIGEPWAVYTLDLPPAAEETLRITLVCPDAADDPASPSPMCRMRLLGVAVVQIGTYATPMDPEPREALSAVLTD